MKKAADATSEDARDLVLSHMFLKKMASENEEETKKYMDEAAELSSIEEESLLDKNVDSARQNSRADQVSSNASLPKKLRGENEYLQEAFADLPFDPTIENEALSRLLTMKKGMSIDTKMMDPLSPDTQEVESPE